jgi:pimeloyl-ACP methyl ester carboxylesterase
LLNVRLLTSTHRLMLSTRGLERTVVHAVDDTPLSDERPRFPVLLFSPAFGQMPTEYTALLEDIASHGYVVVGINPSYFTPVTVFPDGRQAGFHLTWDTILEDYFPTWVADMTFVLDQVAKLDAEAGGPFSGRLDTTRVGAFGHSYGGAAAAGACHLDPRIKAGIDLDGSPRGHPFAWRLEQPFMLVQSWPARGREGRFCRSLKIGHRFAIEGSKHRAFSDEVLLPIPDPAREELVGTISGPRMVRVTSDLVRAFFDVYLNGAISPLLADPSSVYPEIVSQR